MEPQNFIRIGAAEIAIDTIATIHFRGFGKADVYIRNGRKFRICGITIAEQQTAPETFSKTNSTKNN